MKIYWSDREGHFAPESATFHLYPFSTGPILSTKSQVRQLSPPAHFNVVKRTFLPGKKEWVAKVEAVLQLIEEGRVRKVVLARQCILELSTEPNPLALTAALQQKGQNAHVFCVQFNDEAFLGASPERLWQRKGAQVFSEAIAGTRRRGVNGSEDEMLRRELLQSEKDLHEFNLVKEYIRDTLAPHTTSLIFTPTSIHQTPNVQHLYSRCSANLLDPTLEPRLIPLLYPTPALSGLPKRQALATIAELEPFSRGFYGGALGWSTPDASDWIVPIRSCHVKKNLVTLYSGVGIVAASDPEAEWDELNQKIHLYSDLFRLS